MYSVSVSLNRCNVFDFMHTFLYVRLGSMKLNMWLQDSQMFVPSRDNHGINAGIAKWQIYNFKLLIINWSIKWLIYNFIFYISKKFLLNIFKCYRYSVSVLLNRHVISDFIYTSLWD